MDVEQLKRQIADRLRVLRTQKGLTQEKLAELAELHHTYISRLERYKSLPSLEVLARLSGALDCHVSYFLYRDDELDAQDDTIYVDRVSDVVTPAHIYGLLDSCSPGQLQFIKSIVELVRRTPL